MTLIWLLKAHLALRPYNCSPSLTESRICGAMVRFHNDKNQVLAVLGSVGQVNQVEVGNTDSGEQCASRNLFVTSAALTREEQ